MLSVTLKICCCCKILVENKRHHLHEGAKGGTWKLSHFGWLASLTCNLEFHMVFLYRSLINTFQFPSSTKPSNNRTWKVFVVQQLPAILQFYILDWETPVQNEKEPRPTPFFCVQDIPIYSYNSIFHCKLRLEQKESYWKKHRNIFIIIKRYREGVMSDRVAQWISAPDFGSGGRGFESHRGRWCSIPEGSSCFCWWPLTFFVSICTPLNSFAVPSVGLLSKTAIESPLLTLVMAYVPG